MSDAALSTRPLPAGVTAHAVWGHVERADGTPRDRHILQWTHPARTGPPNLVVGMNPSGASEALGDQTMTVLWEFERRWNNGWHVMANVNPTRATEPRGMAWDAEALRWNRMRLEEHAKAVVALGGLVVVAWGSPALPKVHRDLFREEAARIYTLLMDVGAAPLCLGVSRSGAPRHPLMLRYDTPLVPWSPT